MTTRPKTGERRNREGGGATCYPPGQCCLISINTALSTAGYGFVLFELLRLFLLFSLLALFLLLPLF